MEKNTPSSQTPLGSGFGAATTACEVIIGCDLTGKVAIVTGGYSGIGLVTACTLASAGATVLVPARDQGKARAALSNRPGILLEKLDLIDPASIDAFVNRFLDSSRQLDILINNAGIMAAPLTRDARGYESQFATNHLGHFQLTVGLWSALAKAKNARVVSLSSLGHRYSPVDFDDPNFNHRKYDRWAAYGQSKTANALFAVHLDRIGQSSGIRAFSVHPGRIITGLARFMSPEEIKVSGAYDNNGNLVIDPSRNMKTPEMGAATSVWAATSAQLDGRGGVYCENCDIAKAVDDGGAKPGDASVSSGVRPWATDPVSAERLWKMSEELTQQGA